MRRSLTLLATVAILMGLVAAPAALATPPQPVEIATTPGAFTSNIDGCETGTWADELLHIAGNFDKGILNIKVEKTLTCADGGEFVIRFLPKARGFPMPQSGPWRIVGGMIGGEDVHGSGQMHVDIYGGPPEELFTGKIHIG